MKKRFCDWCGKEIKGYDGTTLNFPALLVPCKNGEPCGEIQLDWKDLHTIDYDVCIDCIRKIWSMRKTRSRRKNDTETKA